MTEMLTTKSLSESVADSLSWLNGYDFRYLKSYEQFCRKNSNGFSYIRINSVTNNRINYYLAFYLGVQITEVESWLLNLEGRTRKVNHNDCTIWNYTVNIGPDNHRWKSPLRGTWTLNSHEELDNLSIEISSFIRDIALPFVRDHQDPYAVRRTLIETPGHATNIWPYKTILAIDHLYCALEQMEADIDLLTQRYQQYAIGPRQEFDNFVSLLRNRVSVERGTPSDDANLRL